jgi:hypothetical protein
MSATMFLITLSLPLATVLIVFAMKYHASVRQAEARLANDDAYRQLAVRAAAATAETAATLAAMGATLDDLRARLASVEKILQQVE